MGESPRYATLLYDVRKALDISVNEYFYLDMVYFLSRKTGWCFKALSEVASDMGMEKSGVLRMRDRLIERKLLERNAKGHVRTTDKYESIAIINRGSVEKVNDVKKSALKKSMPALTKSTQRSLSQRVTEGENNNRITLENRAKKLWGSGSKLKSSEPHTGPTIDTKPVDDITSTEGYKKARAAADKVRRQLLQRNLASSLTRQQSLVGNEGSELSTG